MTLKSDLIQNLIDIKIISIFFFIILFTFTADGSVVEDKMIPRLNEGLHEMLSEHFDDAEMIFTGIKESYPDYPLGYFALGTLYSFMMDHFETDQFDDRISKLYKEAEKLSLAGLEKNKKDPWLLFYAGAAKSNSGFMLGRSGNFFSALKTTFSGISYVEDCLEENPQLNDAKMILGSYLYYKSSMTHWLYDNRDKGIAMVEESIKKSNFGRLIAIAGLTWIYIDYDEFEKALSTVDKGLSLYPDSRYFLWGKAVAYFDKGEFHEANKILFKLKEMVSRDKIQTNRNKFNCCYRLAIGFKELGQNEKSLQYITEAQSYELSEKSKERLEDRIDKLEDVREEILDEME